MSSCSGFLVEPNKIVTAGHCIKKDQDCARYKWVFDYKLNSATQKEIKVSETSVYSCSKIISRKYDGVVDYALIELDRDVTGRTPLKYRKHGNIYREEQVFTIGHPKGLPTKIADGALVKKIGDNHFKTNLDSYAGNSGSAVFNAETEEVEGILVKGWEDFIKTEEGCLVSKVCDNDKCGETVSLISNIPDRQYACPSTERLAGCHAGTAVRFAAGVQPRLCGS